MISRCDEDLPESEPEKDPAFARDMAKAKRLAKAFIEGIDDQDIIAISEGWNELAEEMRKLKQKGYFE